MAGPALSRWPVPLLLVAVTLAVWPGAEAPFSRAKTLVLAAGAGLLLLRAGLASAGPPAPLAPRVLAGWGLGALALSALLGPAARASSSSPSSRPRPSPAPRCVPSRGRARGSRGWPSSRRRARTRLAGRAG